MADEAGAVIVAAGSSRRMGGVDKLLAPLGGRPLLAHSITTFVEHPSVHSVVVVVSEANQAEVEDLLGDEESRILRETESARGIHH